MKRFVVVIGCIIITSMVACADETVAGGQASSDITIISEEMEQISETIEEMESETIETASEEVLESAVADIEGADVADEKVVSGEEVLEDSPITLMDTVLFAQRGVNVRSGPGTDYEKIGTLSTNQEVTVTGQDKESGWYQIDYNGTTAFVSDSYLGENKVVVSAPVNNTNNVGNNSSNNSVVNNTTAANTQPPTTVTNTQDANNGGSTSDWFTSEDMENALQFGQQFGLY